VGANPLGSAFVGRGLWVPNLGDGAISVADRATSSVRRMLRVGHGPLAVAAAAGDVWVSNSNDGQLWRLAPS
jgi:DNA-binding beta-propeller fold protein YncE